MCCDGLKGLPESIRATWPLADVQTCVVHLVRTSLRYTSKKHWGQVSPGDARDLHRADRRGRRGPLRRVRRDVAERLPGDDRHLASAWDEFVPFLEFPLELRKIVYTTNAIESLNARFRKRRPPSRALPQRAGRA